MNPLANELNETLSGTAAFDLLSEFGKRFYFPKGIAAQSAEATELAHSHNATIGMAFSEGQPMMTPSLRSLMPELSPKEAVGYAPNAGDAELRKLWKNQMIGKNPGLESVSLSTPMVVAGLTNGISQLADLFLDPDDPVVVPDMFWGNYRLIFQERKCASVVPFPFYTAEGKLNVDGFGDTIRASARKGKAALIVNFPNNPTGYSPSVAEAQALIESLRILAEEGLKILVIVDDAYFGLFYEEDTYKKSLFADLAGLHENLLAVKVDGPTKEDFVWGFRIGFVTFGCPGLDSDQIRAIEQKLLGAIRSSVSNCSRPAQSLLIRAMRSPTYEAEKLAFFIELERRYQAVRGVVAERNDESLLRALPYNSGYFMSFELQKGNAEELRTKLLKGKGVGTIAIQDKYLRVAYAAVEASQIGPLYDEIFAAARELT